MLLLDPPPLSRYLAGLAALALLVGAPIAWALAAARRAPTLKRRPSGGGR
jgi:hypothetical protein